MIKELKTDRLKLRQWIQKDYSVFSRINADPEVMRYFPKLLSKTESDEMASEITHRIQLNGWGFWAVEKISDQTFIGFVGLNKPEYTLPVSPCIEIGWRLDKEHWHHGYATEAAIAALKFAFTSLNLTEVYSFTPISNNRSRAVMERIGMTNTRNNFNHPLITDQHPLQEHVLYRINKLEWDHL